MTPAFLLRSPKLTLLQHYRPAIHHDSEDEDADQSLLHPNPVRPTPSTTDSYPRAETPSGYSFTDSYIGEDTHPPPTYRNNDRLETTYTGATLQDQNAYHNQPTGYNQATLQDATAGFGLPSRAGSLNDTSESNSTEAWKQRQVPGGPGGIRRYQTRKVKLQQGSVLSVEYPVPSAIQNSVQAQYRNDLESGSEEFTHMRCKNVGLRIFNRLS